MVAKVGFDAMMNGEADVASGWKNKLQSTLANITPAGLLAEQHRRMAQPGSADKYAAGVISRSIRQPESSTQPKSSLG